MALYALALSVFVTTRKVKPPNTSAQNEKLARPATVQNPRNAASIARRIVCFFVGGAAFLDSAVCEVLVENVLAVVPNPPPPNAVWLCPAEWERPSS